MKAIFTIIIAIFATVNVFANGGNPTAASTSTTLCASVANEAAMSSEMEAALMMAISNQTATTVATTTDNAVKMTVATSNDIAPAAVATETIELEAEGL